MTAAKTGTIELTSWPHVAEAFRTKQLRQAGYGEGAVITAGTLLDLHGPEHRERRRVENRLFRRQTFAHWEHDVLGDTIEATLQPFVRAGGGDLVQIGYRSAMNLTAQIAGIDIDPHRTSRTDELYDIVKKFSEGATLMHSTRDRDQVRAEVRDAMEHFRNTFYAESLARRVEAVAAGQEPDDVLTVLLANLERLPLDDETVFREICFYLQAGAHSTANTFTHTVDEILLWKDDADSGELDLQVVQRCVHETLRLHPASPTAYRTPLTDVRLRDGVDLPEGSLVVLNLAAANRDTSIFGANADAFDPLRSVPDGVARWGLSFGGGTHACIGAELDGGMEIEPSRPTGEQLFGTVAVIVHAFLQAGGRQDPARPPTLDPGSTRKHFGNYPVLFD